jgi:hypothetical protein
VAVVPDYTERTMATVLDNPVELFLYGILFVVGVGALAFLLVITVIGILVAIPLLLVAVVAWVIGAAVADLAIADRLIGHEDGWLKPLVLAAALNGGLALTGIGALVALVIGAAGFGAVLRPLL